MRLRAFVLTAGLLLLAIRAMAQTVDLEKNRMPMTELTGPRSYHTGDDPAWARPSINDSGWPAIMTVLCLDWIGLLRSAPNQQVPSPARHRHLDRTTTLAF